MNLSREECPMKTTGLRRLFERSIGSPRPPCYNIRASLLVNLSSAAVKWRPMKGSKEPPAGGWKHHRLAIASFAAYLKQRPAAWCGSARLQKRERSYHSLVKMPALKSSDSAPSQGRQKPSLSRTPGAEGELLNRARVLTCI